jgi:ABC-type spermidine/putrescine transport system, permease component II
LLGGAAVALILGFLLLPGLVVTLAAFNSRAILSFPPESWSWRWFAKAIAYEDFQAGFRNGLIVTACASSIALVVGAAFAFALDRYEFRLKRALETVLLSPLVVPHFTIGLGFLILAAQVGFGARLCGGRRLPRGARAAVRAAQRLHLTAQPRPAPGARRREPGRAAAPRAHDHHRAIAAARPRQRLAVRGDPLVQRIYRFAVRHIAAHANPAGCPLQLRAEYADPSMAAVSVIYIVVTATLLILANVFLGLAKVLAVEQPR